ncbi:MAG: hypothetical protein WBL25_18250 [Anaerolineales bacterium]
MSGILFFVRFQNLGILPCVQLYVTARATNRGVKIDLDLACHPHEGLFAGSGSTNFTLAGLPLETVSSVHTNRSGTISLDPHSGHLVIINDLSRAEYSDNIIDKNIRFIANKYPAMRRGWLSEGQNYMLGVLTPN